MIKHKICCIVFYENTKTKQSTNNPEKKAPFMNKCEICGLKDPRLIYILPLKQANGSLITIACEKCAKASSAYCKTHDMQHVGFMDGTTACMKCIDEMVTAHTKNAETIMTRLLGRLSEEEVEELTESAEISAGITGSSEAVAIVRFISTKAVRTGTKFNEVFESVATGVKPISHILSMWR